MTIGEIARPNVMTATRDQSAGNLADVMIEKGVGSVIIEADDRPIGIVTDRDLVEYVLEPRADPATITASDIMSETMATVYEEDDVFDAIATMFEHSVRRMPVVDSSGTLTGIITLDDLVIMLADELDTLAGVVESEFPSY